MRDEVVDKASQLADLSAQTSNADDLFIQK